MLPPCTWHGVVKRLRTNTIKIDCSIAGAALSTKEVLDAQKAFLEAEALYGGYVYTELLLVS